MNEHELLEYIDKIKSSLSTELYNFSTSQKEELFNYINEQDQTLSDSIYNYIKVQKEELFNYINTQDNDLSDSIYSFIQSQKVELLSYINTQDKTLSDSIYNFIQTQDSQSSAEIYKLVENSQKNILDYINYKLSDTQLKFYTEVKSEQDFRLIDDFFSKYSNCKSRIILLGIPEHGNIGDHAIVIGERNFFNTNFPDIPLLLLSWTMLEHYQNFLKFKVSAHDIICIHGGGFLGTIWETEQQHLTISLNVFRHNPIIIMPQSFWVDTDDTHIQLMTDFEDALKNCDDLTVCIREKNSLERFNTKFPEITTLFIPDMAFCIHDKIAHNRIDNILLCFRNDKEKTFTMHQDIYALIKSGGFSTTETSTVINKSIPTGLSSLYVYDKLAEFSTAKLVITDRLHGLIFSVLTNTPCIAFDNLSGKVHGIYDWLNSVFTVKLATCVEDIRENISVLYGKEGPDINLNEYFEHLKLLIEEKLTC